MSINKLIKLANYFEYKLASDADDTPMDKLTMDQVVNYMKSAGFAPKNFDGDQYLFSYKNIEWDFKIFGEDFARFAGSPPPTKQHQIWNVPSPQQIIQKPLYTGKDMPRVFSMIKYTIDKLKLE